MKAIIYDGTTGEILRSFAGPKRSCEVQNLRENESILTDENADIPNQLSGKVVDVDTLTVVDDPNYTPLGTDIGRKQEFLTAGASALDHRDAMAANDNIPQEVVDFADDQLRMLYLIYVHLAGDANRIDGFEDRFFQ